VEYISDHLLEPLDSKAIISWNKLSTKNQNTLRRAIERSVTWEAEHFQGFNYYLMTKISIRDLHDARFIGPARAEELIQELVLVFSKIKDEMFNTSSNKSMTLASLLISTTSLQILAKLSVDEDLEKYLERIGSFALLTTKMRHTLLQELQPSKNPFKRMMYGKREQDIALGKLIDANLRLSFAVAKRTCVDRDIRSRTVAGNLGLLAGVTSFSDKPNIDFESHLMKNIRDFIKELVGDLNLSHNKIVELMLEGNGNEAEENITKEVIPTIVPFESCTTISEIYLELDIELLKLPKFDERALKMLKHRHQAFGEPGKTLDEIGKEWGITRERVRQIVDPLMEVSIRLEREFPALMEALDLFMECNDEEEFAEVVQRNDIFSGEYVTWQRLRGLCRILSLNLLADKVYEKYREWEENFGTRSKIRTQIKKDRSKFGLYDLKVISRKYEIDESKAFKVIAEIYPRSIRSGSLVLARTQNLSTMFENSIAKQLKVKSPLDVGELIVGLRRTGKQRDVPLIGLVSDLTALIEELAGDPPNYLVASERLMEEVEFQTIEKWLIQIFSETNLGILHSNDVVNSALRDGTINVSSVTVYLLNSPIIRSHGRSLFSLVGSDISEDQLDAYIQIIRGTSEASEVTYEMSGASKGILNVKPNLNVITSGIVFLPPGYRKIFEGFEFQSSCECERLKTIQAVKFVPSGFWTGFTAMIRHGFSEHNMKKESTFKFEFDFDNFIVKLLMD
jgi:DNA-directed RNA polymerase sigma subunit (sigma70/sigma32)